MHFKFSKSLDYQLAAIKAVVEVFDTGKNMIQQESVFEMTSVSKIISNSLDVTPERLLGNIQTIQTQNKIEPVISSLDSMDFSIEMETGTGKTYVYLRTILELSQKYGLKKFIILVPSVAIREGVIKTISQLKGHFEELYGMDITKACFEYDSAKLSRVREFAQSVDLKVMIMTVQSFAGNERLVMRQKPDRFNGEQPINLIAETHPIVIMDEPQNMESDLAKAAIADLHPLFKLRYSATHKEVHNLLYRLTPIDAYQKGLVKKIAVYGVRDDTVGKFIFRINAIETQKGEAPKVRVVMEVKNSNGDFLSKEILLKAGDDLERKTRNPLYHDLIINDIDASRGRIELSDGSYHQMLAESENKEAIFRTQIRETIKTHFDKQAELGDAVKVLSLFFIDKVANYIHDNSLIRVIFVEEFERLKWRYERFKNLEASDVHRGYFASKKEKWKNIVQDTKWDSKIDREAYDLIMKNKEQLLSFEEKVSFIFSHSALKEGWDNPNVFQICTLRDIGAERERRQIIGRWLRLPVDIHGDRVYDERTNVLTVIANESYEEYVSGLQSEFDAAGYIGGISTNNAKEKKIIVKTLEKNMKLEEFKMLWEKISKRTKCSLSIDTEKLIAIAVGKINGIDINNLVVTVDKVDVTFGQDGKVETIFKNQSAGVRIEKTISIPNILDRIVRETGLTRETIRTILFQIETLDLLFENPEDYIRSVVVMVTATMNDMLINEGLKYIPTGDAWEIQLLFQEFETLPSKSIESTRWAFERVVFDSEGEKKFALSLEHSSNVVVYTKLPRWFRIETPLGDYIPDWAIVWKTENGEKLFFVRETKFGYSNLRIELPLVEQQKILCGEKHFEAIGFRDFAVAESMELRDLITGKI